MNVKKNTVVRTACLVLALINNILTMIGKESASVLGRGDVFRHFGYRDGGGLRVDVVGE